MGTTTNLGIETPDVGADNNTWGGILNAALSAFDAIFKFDGTGTGVGLSVPSGKKLIATGGELWLPAAASPTLTDAGQISVDTATNVVNVYTNGQLELASTTQVQTLSNKTLSSPVLTGYPSTSTVQTLTAVTTSGQTRTFAFSSGTVAKVTANQAFTLAATGTATRFASGVLYIYNNSGAQILVSAGSGVKFDQDGQVLINDGYVAILPGHWNGSQFVCTSHYNDTASNVFPVQSPTIALPS